MKRSTRLTILVAMLILARGDPTGVAAGHPALSGTTPSNVLDDSPPLAHQDSLFGPKGNCLGKIFFFYPVFMKLQIGPGEQEVAFTGFEDIRSVIVLVSDRHFIFEMHGQRYEPSVEQAPLPTGGYVLLEWSARTSLSAAAEVEPESKLPVPTRGFPIEDEKKARAAAAQPLGSAQCRIVQTAGFLDESAASTSRWDVEHETVFGSTVSVEPHTKLTIMTPPSPSGDSDREPTTVWVSLVAAWEYEAESR